MTSKEVLESIRNECYSENGRKIVVIGRDDERFDVVEKDLEILEILKSILNASFLYLIRNEKDYNKVKEWLNNDK